MGIKSKKRLSPEYTILSILEYLCISSRDTPISKYHIINKLPGIKQQRSDRINNLMDELENNGFIQSIKTPNSTFYKITDKGVTAYHEWIKSFLDFSRSVNKLDHDFD
jgi:DNA-binding PadR family transcriptional regulator